MRSPGFAIIVRGEGGVGERGEFFWMIWELDSWVLPKNSSSLSLKSTTERSSLSTFINVSLLLINSVMHLRWVSFWWSSLYFSRRARSIDNRLHFWRFNASSFSASSRPVIRRPFPFLNLGSDYSESRGSKNDMGIEGRASSLSCHFLLSFAIIRE